MATMDLDHLRVDQLAYWYRQQRGRPVGSADEDWFRAVRDVHLAVAAAYEQGDEEDT